MQAISLLEPAERENFDEARYLAANPDVRAAMQSGIWQSATQHFDLFGVGEGRMQISAADIAPLRQAKMGRLGKKLRTDMEHSVDSDGRYNFLTDALRAETRIVDTDRISANEYDLQVVSLIEKHADGLVLDCGAGSRSLYYPNVVNYEIVAYRSTDVVGVGEHLPFADDTFDAVLSLAVLEHVRDPFRCAAELSRVLKPGGDLICAMPFLQPVHGFPHHYFNATPQGLQRLFEDTIEVTGHEVPESTHPVWALSWMLQSWVRGLPEDQREAFQQMTVGELSAPPGALVHRDFCTALSRDAQFELACSTTLTGVKPER